MTVQQVESNARHFAMTTRPFVLFSTLAGASHPTALPYALSPLEFHALAAMFRNERPSCFIPSMSTSRPPPSPSVKASPRSGRRI